MACISLCLRRHAVRYPPRGDASAPKRPGGSRWGEKTVPATKGRYLSRREALFSIMPAAFNLGFPDSPHVASSLSMEPHQIDVCGCGKPDFPGPAPQVGPSQAILSTGMRSTGHQAWFCVLADILVDIFIPAYSGRTSRMAGRQRKRNRLEYLLIFSVFHQIIRLSYMDGRGL